MLLAIAILNGAMGGRSYARWQTTNRRPDLIAVIVSVATAVFLIAVMLHRRSIW